MKKVEVHIQSYFSIETDLASAFESWPEYVSGNNYDVVLRSSDEEVSTKYVVDKTEKYVDKYVCVKSSSNGELFQRVLGLTTYLLSEHSDNLTIQKWQ